MAESFVVRESRPGGVELLQLDRPPLDGQYPAGQTTTWRVGDPVHDHDGHHGNGGQQRGLAAAAGQLLAAELAAGGTLEDELERRAVDAGPLADDVSE